MSSISVSITTSSRPIQQYIQPQQGDLPVITFNGQTVKPQYNPWSPVGAQVIIYDASSFPNNKYTLLCNEYIGVNIINPNLPYSTIYEVMWDRFCRLYQMSGDPDAYLLILATYCIDYFMPPSVEACNILHNLGAGKPLQNWLQNADRTSLSHDTSKYYTYNPANYIFIGVSDSTFDQAYGELYEQSEPNTPIESNLSKQIEL